MKMARTEGSRRRGERARPTTRTRRMILEEIVFNSCMYALKHGPYQDCCVGRESLIDRSID